MSRLARTAKVLLALVSLAALLVTIAPSLHGLLPILGLFQHFSAQIAGLAALLLLACLALRAWVSAMIAALLVVIHGAALWPFLIPPHETAVEGAPLKVLSVNLYYRNEERAAAVQALLASGADVIGTVETTAQWRDSLAALETVYPYHLDCVGKVFRCGVALYSKIPFKATFADRIGGALPTIVSVTLDWGTRPVTVAVLQLINPLIGIEEDFQAQQAAVATDYFAKLGGDLVVMGDFNSAPWSSLQNGFRAATGLDNRGRLAFTWPSWAPAIFRLPIDQIFVRGDLVARNVQPGAPLGSDHLPIVGDIYRKAE